MSKLVYNIEPASPSMISALDRHCIKREPDGSSNIDKKRSHLNRTLVGHEDGLNKSLKEFYKAGVRRPAAQAERPYLRIVVSASPEYFRPDDPEAVGTWDKDRLDAWLEATMNQLRQEHGADLVFVELHLDEDTPHVHAVVAPTYLKKARKPGKQKRGETAEQFEARKAAALASKGVRTVGRASHPTLSKPDSFQRLRERMTVALDHLGIEYGDDRSIDAPDGQSTREWVIEQAAQIRKEKAELEKERMEFEEEKNRSAVDLAETMDWVERGVQNLKESIDLVQDDAFDAEINFLEMYDEPEQFEVLKNAAPDNRPTLGFRARFWSLNYSDGSGPAPLPQRIRNTLTSAFDRVASWAAELRKRRDVADETSRAAVEAAEVLRASTERDAEQIMEEARERAAHFGSKEVETRKWYSFAELIKKKLKQTFGDDDYQRLANAVNDEWKTHEDNPNRPLPKPGPPSNSGPPGR